MNEMIRKCLDQKCVIYTANGGYVEGCIRSIEENWLSVEKKNGRSELVNLEYISRIEKMPEKKK